MDEKRCSKCGQVKPVVAFTKQNGGKYGVSSRCKVCDVAYRKTSGYKEARRKYRTSSKGASNRRQERIRYFLSEQGKKVRVRNSLTHIARHPERFFARLTIRKMVKRGEIPPAKDLLCATCGKPALEYHHYLGYDREHWKDVIPLCDPCHTEADLKD